MSKREIHLSTISEWKRHKKATNPQNRNPAFFAEVFLPCPHVPTAPHFPVHLILPCTCLSFQAQHFTREMCLTAHLYFCKGWGMKGKLPQGVCRQFFPPGKTIPCLTSALALSSHHTFLLLAEGAEPFPEGREGAHAVFVSGNKWAGCGIDPRRSLIKETLHMLEEHNTKLILKEQLSPSLLMHNNKAPAQCGFCRVLFSPTPTTAMFEGLFKNNKSGEITFMGFCFKYLYVFTKVRGGRSPGV